ncbi:DUF6022 family protein [Paenibacillus spongiae]|uniref:DUF6022 family protein n=1 Tax=Paenibacillus spongiae TaxID=2909671 RepID=A0ABY5S2E6_9BACL|nr:DUF6022 family protein [Paenibacillus spongiae]UVI27740.1 DUF6022 family protein [Paenibacillus spongiae]
MKQLKPLQRYLELFSENRIDAIGRFIGDQINENWQAVLVKNEDKLLKAYNEGGDAAYGTYLNLLFAPIHTQLKEAGLRPTPKFPGDFNISREWGNEDETDQQRWMWSSVHALNGGTVGTIVTIVFHDHTQFRVPRQPRIIALSEYGKEDVVKALSLLSPDFEQALEFTAEYKEYLRNLPS